MCLQRLAELLQLPGVDPTGTNDFRDTPAHTYIRRQYKDRAELLLTLFTHSRAGIDERDGDHHTALHIAAEVCRHYINMEFNTASYSAQLVYWGYHGYNTITNN